MIKIDPIEFFEFLREGQWRIEITGESGYDKQFWMVIIKDPLHFVEVKHIDENFDVSLMQVFRDTVAKFYRISSNKHLLKSFYKRKKL